MTGICDDYLCISKEEEITIQATSHPANLRGSTNPKITDSFSPPDSRYISRERFCLKLNLKTI